MAIYADGESIEFFDSFGRPPEACAFDFGKFLKRYASKSPLKINDKQIQNIFSTVCGQYCLFFLLHRVRGMSMSSIVNLFTKRYDVNDELVNEFIERRYDIDLPVIDNEYIASQVAKVIFKRD